jgi:signal transduction histidine kinase
LRVCAACRDHRGLASKGGGNRVGQSEDPTRQIARLTQELRLRDDFIAIAAHELRNPLTPIALDVDVLLAQARRRPQVDPAEIASLERLQRNIHIFTRRAATLLDVSRLHAGQLTLDPRRIVLSDVVRRVLAASSAVAEHAHCDLAVTLDDEVSGDWDPAAVERIVENLLSNALRYGAGKPIAVTVQMLEDAALVEVSDGGIGIENADQERIFDRFHRIPGAAVSGFGVGLWISRALARAMAGDVTVRSSPGAGSTFILQLPMNPRRDVHAAF